MSRRQRTRRQDIDARARWLARRRNRPKLHSAKRLSRCCRSRLRRPGRSSSPLTPTSKPGAIPLSRSDEWQCVACGWVLPCPDARRYLHCH